MFNTFSFLGLAALFATSILAAPGPPVPPGMVLTPRGPKSPDTMHLVPVGGKVVHIDASTIHVLDASGSIHEVVALDPHATAKSTTGGTLPEETGWVAYANYYNNDAPIGSFGTTWNVPSTPPANTGQTLFLFNSIEPASFDGIMQPVLQWGGSAAGGGAFWAVGSWYLYPGGTFFTPLVTVSPGQSIHGGIQLVGGSGDTYNYLSSFNDLDGTALEVDGGEELVWATITLEAYGVTGSDSYPAGSTVFSGTNLELDNGDFPDITWATVNDDADGITTTVNVEGSMAAVITITY
ncbi:hypothetical protein K438DRAFT_1774458 [Mycena galopus ATCC 62051]|nr:hypothetical protein K438DRAFT_1774458 [Mycena galopus ATCC 62051]